MQTIVLEFKSNFYGPNLSVDVQTKFWCTAVNSQCRSLRWLTNIVDWLGLAESTALHSQSYKQRHYQKLSDSHTIYVSIWQLATCLVHQYQSQVCSILRYWHSAWQNCAAIANARQMISAGRLGVVNFQCINFEVLGSVIFETQLEVFSCPKALTEHQLE